MAGLRAGLDVGGTKCLGVVVDPEGTVVRDARVPTPRGTDALVRALQRPRGPSDNVNALVGATIGYLLATPLAYRSLVYRSVAM